MPSGVPCTILSGVECMALKCRNTLFPSIYLTLLRRMTSAFPCTAQCRTDSSCCSQTRFSRGASYGTCCGSLFTAHREDDHMHSISS